MENIYTTHRDYYDATIGYSTHYLVYRTHYMVYIGDAGRKTANEYIDRRKKISDDYRKIVSDDYHHDMLSLYQAIVKPDGSLEDKYLLRYVDEKGYDMDCKKECCGKCNVCPMTQCPKDIDEGTMLI